jgi:hypothetical protein
VEPPRCAAGRPRRHRPRRPRRCLGGQHRPGSDHLDQVPVRRAGSAVPHLRRTALNAGGPVNESPKRAGSCLLAPRPLRIRLRAAIPTIMRADEAAMVNMPNCHIGAAVDSVTPREHGFEPAYRSLERLPTSMTRGSGFDPESTST